VIGSCACGSCKRFGVDLNTSGCCRESSGNLFA
jgi:hypothetical protein